MGSGQAAPVVLAQALQRNPADAASWARLASLLAPVDRSLAFQLVDTAGLFVPTQVARRLLAELGAMPPERAGRPFAARPVREPLGPFEPAPTPRAQPSPDGRRALVPVDEGWQVFVAGAAAPSLAPEASTSAVAACWLDDDHLVASCAAGLGLLDLGGDGGAATIPCWSLARGAVADVLGPLRQRFLAVAIASGASLSYDVVMVDPRTGETRPIANLCNGFGAGVARWQSGYACVCEGLQPHEVRFVWADNGWRTRMHHSAPLCGIAEMPDGRVASFDESGLVLVWSGDPPRAPRCTQLPGANPGQGPASAVYDAGRDALLWVPDDDVGLRVAQLGGHSTHFVPDVVRCPSWLPLQGDIAPFETTDGWLWLDVRTRCLPEPWRLSATLATEDELGMCPWLSEEGLAAVRTLAELARSEARPDVLARAAEALRAHATWVRCPLLSLDAVVAAVARVVASR